MAFKGIGITTETLAWFQALLEKGIFIVDANGGAELNPALKEVVAALHEVLAGGSVKVTTTQAGAAAVRSDLDQKLQGAFDSVNPTPGTTGGVDTFAP